MLSPYVKIISLVEKLRINESLGWSQGMHNILFSLQKLHSVVWINNIFPMKSPQQ